jgi:hypothetical protein
MKRHMGALHHRSGSDSEFLAADIAEEHARLGFAAHASDACAFAERTDRLTIRPTRLEDVSFGFGLVMEDGVCDVHGFLLKPPLHARGC